MECLIPVFVRPQHFTGINVLKVREFETVHASVYSMKNSLRKKLRSDKIDISIIGIHSYYYANKNDTLDLNIIAEANPRLQNRIMNFISKEDIENISHGKPYPQSYTIFCRSLNRKVNIYWNYPENDLNISPILENYRKMSELSYHMVNMFRTFATFFNIDLLDLGLRKWHIIALVINYLQAVDILLCLPYQDLLGLEDDDFEDFDSDQEDFSLERFDDFISYYLYDWFQCKQESVFICSSSSNERISSSSKKFLHFNHPYTGKLESIFTEKQLSAFLSFLFNCHKYLNCDLKTKTIDIPKTPTMKTSASVTAEHVGKKNICPCKNGDETQNLSSKKAKKNPITIKDRMNQIVPNTISISNPLPHRTTPNNESSSVSFLKNNQDFFLYTFARDQLCPPSYYNFVSKFLDLLEVEVCKVFPGSEVLPFGSCVTGMATSDCDIDCNILNPMNSMISNSKVAVNNLFAHLKKFPLIQRLQKITNARIPILKLWIRKSETTCDISFSSPNGIVNSMMLKSLCQITPIYKYLCVSLKINSKIYEINGNKNAFLSSYAFSLIVLYYLQHCNPPILPDLKEFRANGFTLLNVNHVFLPSESDIQKWKKMALNNKKTLSEHWNSLLSFIENWLVTSEPKIIVDSSGFVDVCDSHTLMDFVERRNLARFLNTQSIFHKTHVVISFIRQQFCALSSFDDLSFNDDTYDLMSEQCFYPHDFADMVKAVGMTRKKNKRR